MIHTPFTEEIPSEFHELCYLPFIWRGVGEGVGGVVWTFFGTVHD